jgi:hypothetical protein
MYLWIKNTHRAGPQVTGLSEDETGDGCWDSISSWNTWVIWFAEKLARTHIWIAAGAGSQALSPGAAKPNCPCRVDNLQRALACKAQLLFVCLSAGLASFYILSSAEDFIDAISKFAF